MTCGRWPMTCAHCLTATRGDLMTALFITFTLGLIILGCVIDQYPFN